MPLYEDSKAPPHRDMPTFERDLEMARLRVVEGLTLVEVAERTGVSRERVRQILRARFGISGVPPAAQHRRRS
jgi:predicted DNA-binding protein (UPF0251 family)